MNEQSLQLTDKELEQIVEYDDWLPFMYERFDVLYNGIPLECACYNPRPGDTRATFIHDGEEFRWFVFIDRETEVEYTIEYIYYIDSGEIDIRHIPKGIDIVVFSKFQN